MEKWEEIFDKEWYLYPADDHSRNIHEEIKSFISKTREEAYKEGRQQGIYEEAMEREKKESSAKQEVLALIEERLEKLSVYYRPIQTAEDYSARDKSADIAEMWKRLEVLSLLQELKN